MVQDALDLLRGAVMIVYPMGLPPHDVIRQEFENTEDLSGTQASLEVRIAFKNSIINTWTAQAVTETRFSRDFLNLVVDFLLNNFKDIRKRRV